MTSKYVGEVSVLWTDGGPEIRMPEDSAVPPKKDWHEHAIWEFNGKRYRPVTERAEDNLNAVICDLAKSGYTHAVKDGKLKPSSLRYAVLTTGVEPFHYSVGK